MTTLIRRTARAYVEAVVAGRLGRRGWLLVAWVLAAGLVSAACLGLAVAVQQAGRLGANDVPAALAHRSVELLRAGGDPPAVAGGPTVDLATDASAFVTVYGADHTVLASTATLHGAVPTVPPGVLDRAAAAGTDQVTWQPAAGVREAVVAQPWSSSSGSGVVVAGVGLGATEHRSQQVLVLSGVVWLVGLLVVTGAAGLLRRRTARAAA